MFLTLCCGMFAVCHHLCLTLLFVVQMIKCIDLFLFAMENEELYAGYDFNYRNTTLMDV